MDPPKEFEDDVVWGIVNGSFNRDMVEAYSTALNELVQRPQELADRISDKVEGPYRPTKEILVSMQTVLRENEGFGLFYDQYLNYADWIVEYMKADYEWFTVARCPLFAKSLGHLLLRGYPDVNVTTEIVEGKWKKSKVRIDDDAYVDATAGLFNRFNSEFPERPVDWFFFQKIQDFMGKDLGRGAFDTYVRMPHLEDEFRKQRDLAKEGIDRFVDKHKLFKQFMEKEDIFQVCSFAHMYVEYFPEWFDVCSRIMINNGYKEDKAKDVLWRLYEHKLERAVHNWREEVDFKLFQGTLLDRGDVLLDTLVKNWRWWSCVAERPEREHFLARDSNGLIRPDYTIRSMILLMDMNWRL